MSRLGEMSEKPTGNDNYDYYDENDELYEYEYAPEEDNEAESDSDYGLQAVLGVIHVQLLYGICLMYLAYMWLHERKPGLCV